MEQSLPKIPELTALFPPETAGRGMITNIPVFLASVKVRDAVQVVLERAVDYDSVNYSYILDGDGVLKGVVSIKELLQAKPSQTMESIMVRDLVTADPMDSVPHVASLAVQHNLKMVPILDHKRRLVGAFSSNELLDILNRQFSNDLLRLSGVTVPSKHYSFDSLKIVYRRLPWMLIGTFGALLTGLIINQFKVSIEKTVLLAVFIPVIMSTGATSANQSAMIFLRNLVHGDIKNRAQYVLNEIKVASLLGVIQSILVFVLISLFVQEIRLALAVAVSLFCTILAGAMIGVLTPMALYKKHLDPALGAGPFLTILKDLISMTLYFTIATALLSRFM